MTDIIIASGFDQLQAHYDTEIAIAKEIGTARKMTSSQRTEAYTALVKASAFKLAIQLVCADYQELARLRKEKHA